MAKAIFYNDDARARILAGAKILYDAVKVTYGPLGGNVVIGHSYYDPTITHDGVTVAQHIELDDSNEATLGQSVGAELIKRAASNLNVLAGDGTTTVTVLTYHILKEANRLIAAGNNPQEVRRGIEDAGAAILEHLATLSEPIDAKSPRVKQIATISAGNAEIGELLADVIKKVGDGASLTVETHQGVNIDAEISEGFTLDYGMTSPLFINDPKKRQTVFGQSAVIVYDNRIDSIDELRPLLSKIIATKTKQVIIIADEVDKAAVRTLNDFRVNEYLEPIIVKAPAFGELRTDIMQDIATFTGGLVIDNLAKAELNAVGRVDKAIITQTKTVLIDGSGKTDAIAARIEDIKTREYDSELDRERGNRRAAALSGKIAVIKVGGTTEPEIEERKYRVDDAVAAVQAALKEGVVTGGGVTLVHLAEFLKPDWKSSDATKAGMIAVKRALEQPFLQIMTNAGLRAESLLDKVIEENIGYDKPIRGVDVRGGKGGLVNLMDVGVIDPILVTKEVIKNSISIAATAATMGALIVEKPEKSIANNA